VKTRAVGSLSISTAGGASSSVAVGRSHTSGALGGSTTRVDNPLVELQQSPQVHAVDLPYDNSGYEEVVPGFDLVAYELVNVMAENAKLGDERPMFASAPSPLARGNTFHGGGGPTTFTQMRLQSFDAGDDDDTITLVVGAPTQVSSSGLNSRLQMKQRKPEDPDDLITRGVHLAANDKKYSEAAKKFQEALDILKAKSTVTPSPRGRAGDSKAFPNIPAVDVEGEDAAIEAPEPEPGVVSCLNQSQLIALVQRLLSRAVKCADNPSMRFADSVVNSPTL
jgi:hypothetical protein